MISKTIYPNGSVVTEYQPSFIMGCACKGNCNCISQTWPKYNQSIYSLTNQQPQVCVQYPMQATVNDQTFYRTNLTSQDNLKNQTIYNIMPSPTKEADNYNPYVLNPFAINSYLQQGYPANLYPVPKNKDWSLVQGEGIRFEEYETGLKIHNAGVLRVSMSQVIGSGIIVQNTGSNKEPQFVIGINNKEFASTNNLIQEVTFNGKAYTPIAGKIYINSGASGTPISKLNSIDNSISIISTSVGEYNIETAKVSVKGSNTKATVNDRRLVNFVDGVNTSPKLTNDNQVSFDVTGVVKSVNNQIPDGNGNISITIASQSIFYQFRKTLTASDITAFQNSGVDIITMTIAQGSKPAVVSGTDGVMIYINGTFLPLDKYTRNGSSITISSSVTINANDSLSIIIIKSN